MKKLYIIISGMALLMGVVFLYIATDSSDVYYELTGHSSTHIDIGIPIVNNDYKVDSKIYLKNPHDYPIEIVGTQKSCVCNALFLTPERFIPAKEYLEVGFVHSDVTNGKGGYFKDRVLLKIRNGEKTENKLIDYSGFVIKSSHTIPEKIELKNTTNNPEIFYVFLSRVGVKDGKLILLPLQQIRSFQSPKYISVKRLDAQKFINYKEVLPQTILPNRKLIKDMPGITKTERELKRFFVDNSELEKSDLWQLFAFSATSDSITSSSEETIAIQTDSLAIEVPVFLQHVSEMQVIPENIAIVNNGHETEYENKIIVSNLTEKQLDIQSVIFSRPEITFSVNKISNFQSEVLISCKLSEGSSFDDVIKLQTNIGSKEIPYQIVKIE